MVDALRWVLPTLVVLALGYLGIGLFVANRLTSTVREPTDQTPADEGLEFQEVGFRSTDGLALKGWWVPGEGSSPAVVMLVHGLEGSKADQHVLKTASVYFEEGYGVLMFDLRGHGESEGMRTTLGYQEVRDVRGALSWLEEQGFESGKAVLHGWSMGGATVLRSAPGRGVAAVVEESGYADLPLLLRDRLPESSGLPPFFNPGIFLMAKLFLDFDPWAVKPGEDAAKLSEEGVPLLIVHSTDDEVVPLEQAEMLAACDPDAELWRIGGYGHVEAYSHPEYRQRLLDFLERTVVEEGL